MQLAKKKKTNFRDNKFMHLFNRMGMHRIRDELEDICFRILNNDARKKQLDEIKVIKNV